MPKVMVKSGRTRQASCAYHSNSLALKCRSMNPPSAMTDPADAPVSL